MERINKDESRRRKRARKARNKKTALDILCLITFIALLIMGGYHQRGYWCMGAEMLAVLPAIVIIIARRFDWRV